MIKIAITLVLVALLMACKKEEQTFGEPISTKSVMTLTNLLETPEKFHDKVITLKGRVDGQCGNRCEFTFRDKNSSVTIYMGDIKAPQIQKGTPITVSAQVFNGEKQMILTAKGFSLGEGGKE